MFSPLMIALLFLLSPVFAFSHSCDNLAALENLPTLQEGRVRPLRVHAQETFKILQGNGHLSSDEALTLYCLIHWQKLEPTAIDLTKYQEQFATQIEHIKTIDLFQLPGKKLSFRELADKEDIVRKMYFKQKENTPFKKELAKLMNRLQLFRQLESGTLWNVYEQKNNWVPFLTFMQNHTANELLQTDVLYSTEHPESHHHLENTFVKVNPFNYAFLTVILGLIFFTVFKNQIFGLLMVGSTLLIEGLGIATRVLISGRAPITNMYETVLFSGFGCLFLVSIIGHLKKEKKFLLAGLSYNLCCLFMIKFANGMLNEQISPLVPVLRDNFWLSTHVTTVILAYSAFAISWPISNWVIIRRSFFQMSKVESVEYNQLIYTCIKWGTVLISAGIILGGVWADYSWGRFWGWDPKETWSLIVLLCYILILHGKYTGLISAHNFAYFTSAAFMMVMMAWFGVNYILAAGLHSYGFSEGGAFFLATFFITQIAVICACYFNEKKRLA